jgi:hypothetical protein
MEHTLTGRHGMFGRHAATADVASAAPSYQAYQILHVAFTLAPLLAGLDKFFQLLVNWDMYLAPAVVKMLPITAHQFMLGVGVVEIIAGLLVAIRPKIGAYVVALWLLGIICNLLLAANYYDIALRDFGLMLGALALGRLSAEYNR